MNVLRLLSIIVLSLSVGCEYGVPPPFPERLRPVHVIVRDDVPDECWQQVLMAVEFWNDRCGVDYLRFERDGVGGRIIVTSDDIDGQYVTGQTSGFEWFPRRRTVVLEVCVLRTTVHEFGHALGLRHPEDDNIDRDNIMLQTTDARRDTTIESWTVTDEQCDIVK